MLIGWLECIVKDYNQKDQAAKSIAKTFAKAGQDIFNHNEGLFQRYLDDLSEEGLYKLLHLDVPAPLAAAGADVDDGEENDEWKSCSSCGKYRKMTREWFELSSVCADLADEHLDVTCEQPCDCDTPCVDFECPCSECVAR